MLEEQKKVDKYIKQFEEGYWKPLALLAALAEEVGEIAREINHLEGDKPKRDGKGELAAELGDLLFAIICIANKYDIDLKKTLDETIKKYNKRDANRWTKKK